MRLRQSGGETAQARARRLGQVALAGFRAATGLPATDEMLLAFFIAGFMACSDDVIPKPRTPP